MAGLQAYQFLRDAHAIVTTLAVQLSVHPQDLIQTVQRQVEQLKTLQKENQALLTECIANEADRLTRVALEIENVRVVLATFERRPVKELRSLADGLKLVEGLLAILITQDGDKISMVVSCATGTHRSARVLLNQLLVPIHGRGGGDDILAQGGANLPGHQFLQYCDSIKLNLPQFLRNPA